MTAIDAAIATAGAGPEQGHREHEAMNEPRSRSVVGLEREHDRCRPRSDEQQRDEPERLPFGQRRERAAAATAAASDDRRWMNA